MKIWQALIFMALGAIIVEAFEYKAWRRYKEGKRESAQFYRNEHK